MGQALVWVSQHVIHVTGVSVVLSLPRIPPSVETWYGQRPLRKTNLVFESNNLRKKRILHHCLWSELGYVSLMVSVGMHTPALALARSTTVTHP